jgi:hypothetical protein
VSQVYGDVNRVLRGGGGSVQGFMTSLNHDHPI